MPKMMKMTSKIKLIIIIRIKKSIRKSSLMKRIMHLMEWRMSCRELANNRMMVAVIRSRCQMWMATKWR